MGVVSGAVCPWRFAGVNAAGGVGLRNSRLGLAHEGSPREGQTIVNRRGKLERLAAIQRSLRSSSPICRITSSGTFPTGSGRGSSAERRRRGGLNTPRSIRRCSCSEMDLRRRSCESVACVRARLQSCRKSRDEPWALAPAYSDHQAFSRRDLNPSLHPLLCGQRPRHPWRVVGDANPSARVHQDDTAVSVQP